MGHCIEFFFVGLLDHIPREWVASILGPGGKLSGICKAALAGFFLDLCSHGILLIGMKLYQRGVSPGQVMAFLISSPWNSLSLTLILWSLIGFKWVLIFIFSSVLIAVISGVIFERLVAISYLSKNPNKIDLPDNFNLSTSVKKSLKNISLTLSPSLLLRIVNIFWRGMVGSRMVLRWIFLGVILAALIRTLISADNFQLYFGATLAGLSLTLLIATVVEVCSEGSVPIAADLFVRAAAPGNSFAFLMTGVATDYTEILSIKDTMGSWKIALFLPLITVPQVVVIAWLLNQI